MPTNRTTMSNSVSKGFTKVKKKRYPKMGSGKKMGYKPNVKNNRNNNQKY